MQPVASSPSTDVAAYNYVTSKSSTTNPSSESSSTGLTQPEDKFEPSGKAPATADATTDAAKVENPLKNFDMAAFQKEIRDQLLQQINAAKEALKSSGTKMNWSSDILYPVDKEEKAAPVPEEWNADNTASRIVDFALSFRPDQANMSDEEYIKTVRKAVQDGFKLAKGDLGELPGPAGKLFNDTYKSAMDKLDKTLEDWQKKSAETGGTATSTSATSAPVTTPTPSTTPVQSGFSVLA